VAGRQVKRTIRGTRADAGAALTAALAARDRGEQRKVSTETFETHALRWLVAKQPRLEESTYADYEAHVRLRLVPAFGKLRLRDLTRHRIDAYIASQHAGRKVSVKTINNSLIPLRQILARCVRDGYIANNPAASDNPTTRCACRMSSLRCGTSTATRPPRTSRPHRRPIARSPSS
jgi:hypothetical protein